MVTETMNREEEAAQNTTHRYRSPEMVKPAPIPESSSPSSSVNNPKVEDFNQNDRTAPPSPSSPKDPIDSKTNNVVNKAKSCKGCLYYSSQFKADSRNPLCVGLTRSLPVVPRYIVGETEMEASKEGRRFENFRYACVGYSLYPDRKEQASDEQKSETKLPVCVGLEILVDQRLVDRQAKTAESPSAPSHIHNKEDVNGLPQRHPPKPANSTGDDFFSRFNRNANLVANGVAKNVRKVGNQIKQGVDDILYPYRRRPK